MDNLEKTNHTSVEIRQEFPNPVFATKGSLPGEINLQWDAVEGARNYVLQMSTNKGHKWEQIDIVSEPYYMIDGLDITKDHYFRVAAVFSNGQGEWSEPILKSK